MALAAVSACDTTCQARCKLLTRHGLKMERNVSHELPVDRYISTTLPTSYPFLPPSDRPAILAARITLGRVESYAEEKRKWDGIRKTLGETFQSST